VIFCASVVDEFLCEWLCFLCEQIEERKQFRQNIFTTANAPNLLENLQRQKFCKADIIPLIINKNHNSFLHSEENNFAQDNNIWS
jgi:hypothetical protein